MSSLNYKCLTPAEASEHFKVTENTLRTWSKQGKIRYEVTSGGHRRYLVVDEHLRQRKNIIYARVSSKKQKGDLERQVNFIREKYPNHEVITDIGSGINYKRPGFISILEQLFQGNIGEVVVYSSDRFARLGAGELFIWMFRQFDAKLMFIIENSEEDETEFTSDLMEVITVFSARYYGKRKYKGQKDKVLPNTGTN